MTPEGFAPPLGLHPHPAQQDIVLKPGDRPSLWPTRPV
jgi:hypothetical protein